MKRSEMELLLASSIHDMKNSIGMILESVEQASADEKEARDKHLATLRYEALRLNNDLIHLLGVYRINNKELPLTIDEHDVIDVMQQQEFKNGALCLKYNIRLEILCDDDLWYFDEYLVGSVLNNIIVNAVRYTKQTIRLKAEIKEDFLIVQVEDDGPGYPASMLQGPTRSLKPIDFRSGSTSLGLYFASKVAGLHSANNQKGYITLENGGSLGGGVFSLYLP